MGNKKRVFVYVRVSTNRQAEEGYSIPQQIERLQKYCDAMGWILVKVYTDDGYSGGSLERPAMEQMIKDLEVGNADIVLVDKLDRLSRSQFDTLYMIQEVFDKNNVAFVSRNESFDTSSAFGKAMVGILAVFAELERSKIKERMADGKEGRAKEGRYKGGGYVPIGYDYNIKTGLLEVNDYESMQVQEIFSMYNARMPINGIVRTMNDKGSRTKYGDWKEQTIRGMVKRKVYIGLNEFKGKVYQGLHEPIIDEQTFAIAQEIAKEREIAYENRKINCEYKAPLGGLIYCANCGSKYHLRTASNDKKGMPKKYYICYSRSKSDKRYVRDANCKNKNYRNFAIEEVIFNEIRKLKTDPEYVPAIQDSIDNTHRINLINNRIKQVESQISKFMDLYSLSDMDLNSVTDKIKPLNDEKKTLQQELEYLGVPEEMTPQEQVVSLVDMFEAALKEDDSLKVHAIISELIEKIVIDGEDVSIHWNF